jgi:PIN domain nuclease of toxin-antitoxin system
VPITGEHAAAVAKLPAVHADPFDRMLVAQAKTEPLLLLTNDAVLAGYGDCVELVAAKP